MCGLPVRFARGHGLLGRQAQFRCAVHVRRAQPRADDFSRTPVSRFSSSSTHEAFAGNSRHPRAGLVSLKPTGTSTVPPVRWSRHAAACESRRPGGGCGPGNTCMARPQAPFVDGTCIAQLGELTCPSPYVFRYLYYNEALDNRGCSPCSCSSPSGASCSGSVTVASDNGCSADRSTLSTVGSCAALGADPTPPNPPASAVAQCFLHGRRCERRRLLAFGRPTHSAAL